MRKRTSNKTLLIGGVAALVILGAGGLYLAMGRSDPPAAEGAAVAPKATKAATFSASRSKTTAMTRAASIPVATSTCIRSSSSMRMS